MAHTEKGADSLDSFPQLSVGIPMLPTLPYRSLQSILTFGCHLPYSVPSPLLHSVQISALVYTAS